MDVYTIATSSKIYSVLQFFSIKVPSQSVLVLVIID